MESMDRNQAFAFLGCPRMQATTDIIARVDSRAASSELPSRRPPPPNNGKLLERALTELEEICALAMLDPRDPAAGLPGVRPSFLKVARCRGPLLIQRNGLAHGERAAVFRALDLTWGKEVALKVLLPDALLVPGIMERLAARPCADSRFSSSDLAGVYSLGRAEGMTLSPWSSSRWRRCVNNFERARDRDLESSGLSAAAIEGLIKADLRRLNVCSRQGPPPQSQAETC